MRPRRGRGELSHGMSECAVRPKTPLDRAGPLQVPLPVRVTSTQAVGI